MVLSLIGFDHHTAPIEVRERLAFRWEELAAALPMALQPGLQEVAILSTCNRVEVYAVGAEQGVVFNQVVDFLADYHSLHREYFEPYLYQYQDNKAIRHVCATAAGAKSLILGEAQIQGQIRQAAACAQKAQTAGPVLSALFRSALVAGKRARSETGIARSAVSISHAGVELAKQLLGDLQPLHVLLIGSGKMSELAARNLLANGVGKITLVNRSLERAQALAAGWEGVALPLEELPQALLAADVVITSTAAPHMIIDAELIADVLRARPQRQLILIDLALPRDIDPAASTIPGAHLYNIDDLHSVVGMNKERRSAELNAVYSIIEEEALHFENWLATRTISPTLEDLRAHADAIRRAELKKALQRLGPLSEREQQIIETLSSGIINKLLHEPTIRLREQATKGKGNEYAKTVQYLFGLESKE